jgi:TolA-binding protein
MAPKTNLHFRSACLDSIRRELNSSGVAAMIHRLMRIFLALVLAAAFVVPSPLALACGPDFTGPDFTDTTGPEAPSGDYNRGKLDLLQHTYWHHPLYIAYRNLSGQPFTAAELKALAEPSAEETAAAKDWIKAWEESRAKILGKLPDTHLENNGYGIARPVSRSETYLVYYNCLNSAFENAVQTLNNRVQQFGAQNPIVQDWIAAQDQVFENCGSAAPGYPPEPRPATIPVAAHRSDPDVVRADRAYQIAAAHFYAGEYDLAQAAFETIAKDSASPYQKLAPYLVARTLIRKSTVDTGDDTYDPQALAQAETRLRAVLADKDLQEFQAPTQRLLGFVQIRLHRRQRFRELETSLSRGGTSQTFRQDLTDYLWLLDRPVLTKTVATPSPSAGQPPTKGSTLDEESRFEPGDMTDWIFTFQQTDDSAMKHALRRWQETKSVPWLVAAIAKVPATDAAAADLSAVAMKIAPDSPAYVTATFHRLRILAQTGSSEAASRQIDQLLAQRTPVLSRSATNQFRALRMKYASSLQDFLHFAPRVSSDAPANPDSASTSSDLAAAPNKMISYFDADASVVFTEKLPLQLLAEAAKSTTLPAWLRRDVVIAAWTRAILLHNEGLARELAPTAQELVPEIKGPLDDYLKAADSPAREFAAVFAILRNPGFRSFVSAGYPRGTLYTVGEPRFDRLDNLHDNWWCASAPTSQNQAYGANYYTMFATLSSPLSEIYPQGKVPSPIFLTEDDRATATKERAELESQPAAPNWLGKQALGWATSHPDDPRVPEALHLVVRARRYGCSDSSTENYSKQAFTLLHKRYPDSDWTKKTPYWFE